MSRRAAREGARPNQMSRDEILAGKAALQQQLKDLEEPCGSSSAWGAAGALGAATRSALGAQSVRVRRVGRRAARVGGAHLLGAQSVRTSLTHAPPPPTPTPTARLGGHFGSARRVADVVAADHRRFASNGAGSKEAPARAARPAGAGLRAQFERYMS